MEKKKFVPGKQTEDALAELNAHKGKKPGAYESQWKQPADELLHKIQNRGPFQYDPGKDPLYGQAVDQHVRLGRKAMMDTLGKSAALTGGYGNSYGAAAAQQTYGEYLQALMARLPQFQEMALKQHAQQGRDLMDQYQLLSQREKDAYGQYQKILNQYFAQQDRLQNAYDREHDRDYERYVNDRDYDYALDRDQKEDAARAEQALREQQRWDQDREYQAQRDKIQDEQWERQFAEDQRRYELEWAAKHAPASGGSSGGGGGGSRRPPSKNFSKHQSTHSMTEREYEASRKRAQESGHYPKLPAGPVWTPHQRPSARPVHKITLW